MGHLPWANRLDVDEVGLRPGDPPEGFDSVSEAADSGWITLGAEDHKVVHGPGSQILAVAVGRQPCGDVSRVHGDQVHAAFPQRLGQPRPLSCDDKLHPVPGSVREHAGHCLPHPGLRHPPDHGNPNRSLIGLGRTLGLWAE